LRKIRDLLFSELINFIDKIILEKSIIEFLSHENSLELRKITGKILETLGEIRNSTKWV
jgi:hypothetical protein